MQMKKIQIGAMLLSLNLITKAQLDAAILEQSVTGHKLGHIVVSLGLIGEDQLLNLLAEQMQVPFIDLKTFVVKPEVALTLPELIARHFRCLVLEEDNIGFLVGMIDPQDVLAHDELEKTLKKPIRYAIVRESDLQKIIDLIYRHTTELSSLSEELSTEMRKPDYDITQLTSGLAASDIPVVKMLTSIFKDAVQVNASDVHIEPDEAVLRIRQRIDGVLYEQILKEKNVAEALSLRLKLMAGLNIAEKRIPQDGRFSIKIQNKNFDVRLSTMRGQFGESVVMRLLNQSENLLILDELNMPPAILEALHKIIALPQGLFLITGPTGSGKTTTLYAMLNQVNKPDVKIITVEDPVEYRLKRITQVQVQPFIDLTFARVLRSTLRQDPDIIMIGELRDQETVEIAIRAAMTGHFVFATLHTNDAVSSAERLIDMGAESYLIASVLRATLSQRLVRQICKNCITDYTLSTSEAIWLSSIKGFSADKMTFKYGKGCSFCYHTGYKGQRGIFELLEMNSALGEALRRGDTANFVRIASLDKNFRPLILSGLDMVARGITTIEEVIRTVGDMIPDSMKKQVLSKEMA